MATSLLVIVNIDFAKRVCLYKSRNIVVFGFVKVIIYKLLQLHTRGHDIDTILPKGVKYC